MDVKLQVRLDTSLHEQLVAASKANHRSLNAEILDRLRTSEALRAENDALKGRVEAVEAVRQEVESGSKEFREEVNALHDQIAHLRERASEHEEKERNLRAKETEINADRDRLRDILRSERGKSEALLTRLEEQAHQHKLAREEWKRTDSEINARLNSEISAARAHVQALEMQYRDLAVFFHLFVVALRSMYEALPDIERENPFYAPLLGIANEVVHQQGTPAELLTKFLAGQTNTLVASRVKQALDMLVWANNLALESREVEASSSAPRSKAKVRAALSSPRSIAQHIPEARQAANSKSAAVDSGVRFLSPESAKRPEGLEPPLAGAARSSSQRIVQDIPEARLEPENNKGESSAPSTVTPLRPHTMEIELTDEQLAPLEKIAKERGLDLEVVMRQFALEGAKELLRAQGSVAAPKSTGGQLMLDEPELHLHPPAPTKKPTAKKKGGQ